MKILLTGGGTGGHFYPLIAIAERIRTLTRERHLVNAELYYMSSNEYDKEALTTNDIKFIQVYTGKLRLYPSFKNFTDIFKVGLGVIQAIFKLFFLYPDCVISKGGHGAFPAVFAARMLNIPVIIHESDSYPGRVNLWSGKFAKNVGLAYKDAEDFLINLKQQLLVYQYVVKLCIYRQPKMEQYFIILMNIYRLFLCMLVTWCGKDK